MCNMNQDGSLWLFNQLYGMNVIPPTEAQDVFIKAVLICAKGDGVISPEERDWVVRRAAALRNPSYELAKTYTADEDLLEVISKSSAVDKSGRRTIIYVAIQACAADGEYNSEEREKVHQMAKFLGIEEEVVNQIEQFCAEEAKMREQRISLIFPEGVPY